MTLSLRRYSVLCLLLLPKTHTRTHAHKMEFKPKCIFQWIFFKKTTTTVWFSEDTRLLSLRHNQSRVPEAFEPIQQNLGRHQSHFLKKCWHNKIRVQRKILL